MSYYTPKRHQNMDAQVDLRTMNRKFVREFIQIYKDHPCLWDMKHPSYNNRFLKRKAYGKLIDMCRSVDKTANRDFVSKKIASLRCSFRKEWRKISKAIEAASHDTNAQERLRTPVSLWYFDLLLFTVDKKSVEKYMTYRPDAYMQSDDEETLSSIKMGSAKTISNNDLDMRSMGKMFVTDFITTYRENMCLWLTKCKDYSDKQKKKEAYAKLIVKARQVVPNADKEFVTKKIASLRGTFRKEWNKINRAREKGEEYVTNLWYYDLLLFTLNKDSDCEQINFKEAYKQEPDLDLHERCNDKTWQENYDDTADDDMQYEDSNSIHDYNSVHEDEEDGATLTTDPLGHIENNNGRRSRNDSVYLPSSHQATRNITSTVQSQVGRELNSRQINTGIHQDEHDAYGVTVAAKLRKMDSVQRLYAENIINQALYKGALYALTDQSAILEPQPHF